MQLRLIIYIFYKSGRTKYEYLLWETIIGKVNFTKFLGIYIYENLRWNKHTHKVTQKLTRSYYATNKAKKTFVNSVLLYGVPQLNLRYYTMG